MSSKLHIIIADDHAIVRKGLAQIILEQYPGSILREVENSDQLIAVIGEREWDIAICDINMPGQSGIESLHRIRQLAPDLPVLIMSMYSEDQYAIRAYKSGASAYLCKETVHYNLLPAIDTVLRGKKFVTASIAEILASQIDPKKASKTHDQLSNREFEVFIFLATGLSLSQIAQKLNVSIPTISTYRGRVLKKLNIKSNVELIKYAIEEKLI